MTGGALGAEGGTELRGLGVVWGKTLVGQSLYPLEAHLLDTAAFAVALWDAVLSNPVKEFIARGLSPCVGSPRAGFAFVAAAHDCGKADPWFQCQVASKAASKFTSNSVALAVDGLPPVPDPTGLLRAMSIPGGSVRRLMRHEAGSAVALNRYGAPGWVGTAVSGHHGRYAPDAPPRDTRPVARYRSWLMDSAWGEEQQRMIRLVADAVGWPGFPDKSTRDDTLVAASTIPLVTGLICLADWSASDETFLASAPLTRLRHDPQAYFEERAVQAAAAVPLTIGVPTRPTGRFSEVFPGFTPDRDVQKWAVAHAGESPRLTIISVPMGEGKTETALWMHSTSTSNDGLVFALPTMATADAMFARVQSFYAQTPALAALRHGHALLNAFYSTAITTPVGVCDEEGGLTGSEWLNGRHRSLTAPVTVSSCDQVLAAAVNHRFLPVRLASLANKHVVLDEVHTYDAYQDVLLTRLLGWLGQFGTRVTLLSATLPTRRIAAYVRAYAAGAGSQLEGTIDGTYPCVTSTVPGGTVVQVPVTAHRNYRHGLEIADLRVEADNYAGFRDEFAAATARFVDDLRLENPLARIGVIVNTVDRAIAIARYISTQPAPVVLHARMTSAQRAARGDELLRRLGPQGDAERLTMVATQVAEASLDIDVDILVTDLAPMTSLLQRMGRQWRHSQPTAQGWLHRGDRVRSGVRPIAHILVARDPDGGRHRLAAMPYAQAEIEKTLVEGLNDGTRTEIAIPGELQQLVDACDVTLDDLTDGDTDQPQIAQVISHLGKQAGDASAAARVGTDVAQFEEAWQMNPAWDENATLQAFTNASLWSAEAVTRLRDGDSLQLLVCDRSGQTVFAYQSDPTMVVGEVLSQAQIVATLGCVVAVSGALAVTIRASIPEPSGWGEQPTALLRSVLPTSVEDLAKLGLALDADLGLTRE